MTVRGEHDGRLDMFILANAEQGLDFGDQRQWLDDPAGEHAQGEARSTVGRAVEQLQLRRQHAVADAGPPLEAPSHRCHSSTMKLSNAGAAARGWRTATTICSGSGSGATRSG